MDVLVFSTLHLKILGGVLRKNEDLDEANKKRARQLITLKKDLPMSVLLEHIAQAFGKGNSEKFCHSMSMSLSYFGRCSCKGDPQVGSNPVSRKSGSLFQSDPH